MLEFLQPLVDLVTKAIPAIAKQNERDKAAKLGAELFLLYVQCNEALVLGAQIVHMLEGYLEEVARGSRWADGSREAVSRRMREQLHNLTGIANRLEEFQFGLHVLDGPAYLELKFLTDMKGNALHALCAALDEERLPLRTAGVLIDNDGVLQLPDDGPRHRALAEVQHRLADELTANSVPLDLPWGPDVAATISRYLAVRKPHEQLERIRTALERIREALVANFSLNDILLRAGDPRGNRGRGFR